MYKSGYGQVVTPVSARGDRGQEIDRDKDLTVKNMSYMDLLTCLHEGWGRGGCTKVGMASQGKGWFVCMEGGREGMGCKQLELRKTFI